MYQKLISIKPIAAAVPIALFIVKPTNFNIGTFIIAPPIPIKEDIKPQKFLKLSLNYTKFNFIFDLSFKKIKFRAKKYMIKLKKSTKDLVSIKAAEKAPIITPIITNIP